MEGLDLEKVRVELGLEKHLLPLDQWPDKALGLLSRIQQLGVLGQHADLVRQKQQPNMTLGYICDTIVLESAAALQCHMVKRLRHYIVRLLSDQAPKTVKKPKPKITIKPKTVKSDPEPVVVRKPEPKAERKATRRFS